MASSKLFSRDEVRKHTSDDSLWCIIDSVVYDVSDFQHTHPGGASVLCQVAGQDATSAFYSLHRHEVLAQNNDLVIGQIADEKPQVKTRMPGELNTVPYAEPLWLAPQYRSLPYYKPSHRRLQRAARTFCDIEMRPEAAACEKEGRLISQSMIQRLVACHMLHMRFGPGEHLKGLKLMGGGIVEPEEFDHFHTMILLAESTRILSRGFNDAFLAGFDIALPIINNFARHQTWSKSVIDDVLAGRKIICLAITEAHAGSDVAGIQTKAEKTADGKHYIVNGSKKWITNGTFSDYFVTAVRTGGPGINGLSVLLIERGEGVETRPIKTSYSPAAGTACVTFDNVKVPVGNLVGQENQGFSAIVSNFNHERWIIAVMSVSFSRGITEECLKWANQRLVFGKRLIDQPVIRQKLAKMIALTEANQSWLEAITYQMCHMPYQEQSKRLAGPIALFKMNCSRAAHEIADEAVQIWGGRALTASGMGKHIEAFNRNYKFDSILGGADEILADLAIKQVTRNMPKSSRL